MISRIFIILSPIFLVASCTLSYIAKDKKPPEGDSNVKRMISIRYELKSNLSKRDESYWFGLMKASIEAESGIRVCKPEEVCDCTLRVILHDDQEDWSSWKVYVSGLTLGLIPVKFKAKYNIVIESSGNQRVYSNAVNTWAHLGLIPVAPFTPSRQMETKRFAKDIISDLLKQECGK